MFELITPVSYWVLIGLWFVILWLYLSYLRKFKTADKTVSVLLVLLAIDAFRTFFESIYFGFYFNSLYGFLPKSVHDLLSQPQFVVIPKLFNVFAGLLILFLLVRHWLPREMIKRKNDEDRLKLQARRAQALLELPHAADSMEETEFMQHAQEMAEKLTGSRIAFIHFVHPDQNNIEFVTWSKATVEHYCTATYDKHYPVNKAGIWADALRQKQPVVCNDYHNYPHKKGLPEGHSVLNRLVSVPVIEGDKVVMLSGVGNKDNDYTDQDVETLQLISDSIWQIVQRKRVAKELDRHHHHLEELVSERTDELLRQQVFTDTVLENIEDGIVACDEHGNLSLFNRATQNMHGIDREDTPPEQWAEHYRLLHEDSKTLLSTEEIPLFRAFKGEKVSKQYLVIEHANGDKRTVICNGQPMLDKRGNKMGAVISMHDVTFHKSAELELIKSKQAAEVANQAKSSFLANMSHELRTPMHAIMSFTDLARKRVEEEKTTHYLDNIKASSVRLTNLLDDLLDLSKLESGKLVPEFEEFDFVSVVLSAIDQINSLLDEKGISIEFNADKSLHAEFDPKLIMQVIVNLLSNAIKFSPDNSLIKINADIILAEAKGTRSNIIECSVADEGIGIPENEIGSVFDKFIQSTKTRSDKGGTGLGLAISKEIIELHQGRIWAESPPSGKKTGSIFSFHIPVKLDATET